MAGEAFEAAFRRRMTDGLTKAIQSGADGRDIASAALNTAIGPGSTALALVERMPRFTLPVFGAGVGAVLVKVIDSVLPNDNRPAVRQAKLLLKAIGPHFFIAAGEAVPDAIERSLDQVRTADAGNMPDSAQTAGLDAVLWTSLRPEMIFVIARDSSGQIRFDSSDPGTQVPLVIGDNATSFYLVKRDWDSAQGAQFVMVGQGANRRRQNLPATRVPYEILPLDAALARVGGLGTISAADIEAIRAASKRPTTVDLFGQPAVDCLFALSETKSRMAALARGLGEDLLKDVQDNADPSLVRAWGERFAPRIQNNVFSIDDYNAALEAVDDILKGELTTVNKIRLAVHRFRTDQGSVGTLRALETLVLALWWPILFGCMAIATFMGALKALVVGGFVTDITKTYTIDPSWYDVFFPNMWAHLINYGWEATVISGKWLAFYQTVSGYAVICIALLLLRPIQAAVDIVTFFSDKDEEWLTSFGKKVSAYVAIFGMVVAFLIWLNVPVTYRALLLMAAFGAVGIGMLLSDAGWHEKIRRMALRMSDRFAIPIVIAAILLALVGGVFVGNPAESLPVLNWFSNLLDNLKVWVTQSKWMASIGLGVIGLFLAAIFVWFAEKFVGESWFVRLLGAVLVVALIVLPWVDPPKDWFAEDAASAATEQLVETAVPVVAPQPVVVVQQQTQPRPVVKSPNPAVVRRPRKARSRKVKPDCNRLSEHARRRWGCP